MSSDVDFIMGELQQKRGLPHLEALRRQVRSSANFTASGSSPDSIIRQAISNAIETVAQQGDKLVESNLTDQATAIGFALRKMGYDGNGPSAGQNPHGPAARYGRPTKNAWQR